MAALNFDPSSVEAPCEFDNLPDLPAIHRLKSRRQWVCWKYVYDPTKDKPDKPLYQPSNGMLASHSKPYHWSSYDQAVAGAKRWRMDGVGYVLTADDEITGYDLDGCRDALTGEIGPEAQAIIDLAETYCEVSPSGSGLRLLGHGKIDAAIKRDPIGVEVYPKQRYLTITGWHLPQTPTDILPCPKTLETLRARVAAFDADMAAKKVESNVLPFRPAGGGSLPAAEAGGSPFFRNVNTAALENIVRWVGDLFGSAARHQPGTGAYRISSRALGRNLQEDLSIAPNGICDFGVGDMGDARLGARTPIDLTMEYGGAPDAVQAALWLCDRLGVQPEDMGWDAGAAEGAEIAAALLARRVIEQPDGTLKDAVTGEVVPEPALSESPQDYPQARLQVPGLIGEIADWIMSTSMFPCRLFAVTAALTAIGTAVGRQVYTGLPRSSSALYWLMIAPTAGGKDRPQEAVKQLYHAAGLSHLLRSSVSSSAKLGMSLYEQPTQCQIIDEVGKVLRKFVSRNASAQEMALLDDYCSVWGKNLGSFEPEGVTVRTDTSIRQPCLTFLGATTPVNFYSQLRSAQVAGGFLNRFLVVQRHQRVEPNPDVQPEESVPAHFIEALRTLRTWQDHGLTAPSTQADTADNPPAPFIAPASPEATALLKAAQDRGRAMIVQSDEDPILEVYARSAEMTKRLAMVLACGRHWRDMAACRIEAEDVAFASGLVDWSMGSFVQGLRDHMAENEHQANAKMVLTIVRKARRITRSDLYRRVDNRLQAKELTGILANLCEAGKIQILEEKPPEGSRGGRPKVTYVLGPG